MNPNKNYVKKVLGLSDAELAELEQADKMIDRDAGNKTHLDFDLSPEQEKVSKEMRRAETVKKSKPVYKFEKKPRAPRKGDDAKRTIIAEIARFLQENTAFSIENVEIANETKLITFNFEGNSFKLDLIKTKK